MSQFYITGDTHGYLENIIDWKKENHIPDGTYLIILGDTCVNYCTRFYNDKYHNTAFSLAMKHRYEDTGLNFLIIQGNHEARVESMDCYRDIKMFGGTVSIEPGLEHLIFLRDGETYMFNHSRVLVVGGAWSPDYRKRMKIGMPFFKDEQMSPELMDRTLNRYRGSTVDCILSHACPTSDEPVETFRYKNLDECDKTTPIFLESVKQSVNYSKWYCGHYHINRKKGKLRYMYKDIEPFE